MFTLKDSNITIVGLGLMGGSLALALKGQCASLMGVDADLSARELALRQKVVDRAEGDPAKLLPSANVIILATPVTAILSLLDQLPELMPNPCIVMDLGSTKKAVAEKMDALPERFEPIAGHPICGKEKLGLANADATLFRSMPFVFTPTARTTDRARSAAEQITKTTGANIQFMDAGLHDRMLASTSHLPYVLSSALALSLSEDCKPVIGSGFRSVSRLARTPSSMMLGVMKTNRQNILEAVWKFQDKLSTLEAALSEEDFSALESTLDLARSCCASLTNDD
jgi:prephenate dehydrogenase